MTQFQVLARQAALAATVACVFASTLAVWPSIGEARKAKAASGPAGPSAQGPQAGAGGDAAQKAAETEAAKKAYDAGLKAYAAGKFKPSIEQLSVAIKSGKLSSPELAKAMFTRGRAYKKDNQAGLAISDLTSAIWLKNGLSPDEQKSAMAERSEAYSMAGLSDTGSRPDQRVIGTPAVASAPASNVTANAAPGPNAGSAGLSAAAVAEAANAQKAAANTDAASAESTPSPVNGETTLQSAAAGSVAGTPAKPASSGIAGFFGWGQSSTPQPQPEPAPVAAAPSTGSSFTQTVTAIPGNVSGFFSNMFSGGGSSAPAPAAPPPAGVTTASTVAVAPETSSWSSATTVANHGQHDVIRAEKASYSREAQPAAPVVTKGKFKIHIAALRSKAQADALAQKLMAEHGAELGNHRPVVDSAVIGSMGTFYRVRIGGYASQAEPRSLCNKLRSSGLDCLVVTN
ncbi:SPOR domain-containing protein [Hyphomicrobium sp. DY-1]|uniref:SPOR domain-containing protein n=1 Tax=Hyphomicrobium sp. DY-1 TaxID=3075650 RepID=UPI0039C1E3B5